MQLDWIYQYCSSKNGVSEHFPFDDNTLVFKVGSKIFLLLSLSNWEAGTCDVNLKCDPDQAEELRAIHSEIRPGYHMNKKHWNTVSCKGSLPLSLIKQLIDHSYALVRASLTKKERAELFEE